MLISYKKIEDKDIQSIKKNTALSSGLPVSVQKNLVE
jgi:hypothetical protein